MDVRNDSLLHQHSDRISEWMQRIAQHERSVAGESDAASPFASMLLQGIQQVDNSQRESQSMIEQLMSGEEVNQAEVFTSVQKADMSFRMLVQIRNKLLQAFEELNAIRV